MTRLVCSENGLHDSTASSRADFFTSTSLSKDFDYSLGAQKFLIEISDKTKGNDLALECLSNILNPYVIFRLDLLDLASLLVFIRITYDCMHDDSYTEASCSGHLCNWGYLQTTTVIKISSILLQLVLPGTQR